MRIGFEFTLIVKLFTVDCAKVHRNLANFKFGSTEIDIENIKSAGLEGMFVPVEVFEGDRDELQKCWRLVDVRDLHMLVAIAGRW